MTGLVVTEAFPIFEKGFPKEMIDRWVKENSLPEVLINHATSGTTIIEEQGRAHVESGKPILYTAGDNVWQVATHETFFRLDRLNSVCKSARKICDEFFEK